MLGAVELGPWELGSENVAPWLAIAAEPEDTWVVPAREDFLVHFQDMAWTVPGRDDEFT